MKRCRDLKDWTRSTRSTHRRLICVCRSFHGRHSVQPKPPSKLHTLLDLRGNIRSFSFIINGKMHDVRILDHLVPEPGAFYVMDRGYVDFERLGRLDDAGSFFVNGCRAAASRSSRGHQGGGHHVTRTSRRRDTDLLGRGEYEGTFVGLQIAGPNP